LPPPPEDYLERSIENLAKEWDKTLRKWMGNIYDVYEDRFWNLVNYSNKKRKEKTEKIEPKKSYEILPPRIGETGIRVPVKEEETQTEKIEPKKPDLFQQIQEAYKKEVKEKLPILEKDVNYILESFKRYGKALEKDEVVTVYLESEEGRFINIKYAPQLLIDKLNKIEEKYLLSFEDKDKIKKLREELDSISEKLTPYKSKSKSREQYGKHIGIVIFLLMLLALPFFFYQKITALAALPPVPALSFFGFIIILLLFLLTTRRKRF
jgi:hypothetical protein